MKRAFITLFVIILSAMIIAGCGNPQDSRGTDVKRMQEAATTQKQELSAVDLLRSHFIEKGEKTEYGYRLTLQSDNGLATFIVQTDRKRAIGANNEVEKGTEGICIESVIIAEGVKHMHEIAIYEGREKYLVNYPANSAISYISYGRMSPGKYPSGDWYEMISASDEVAELTPGMVSVSTPVRLAGANKIFEDNDIPINMNDLGLNLE